MSERNKFAAMVEVLLILQVLLFQRDILVDASIRNEKPVISGLDLNIVKEHSSDQLSVKELQKEKPENNDQLYYLPTQTTFDDSPSIQMSVGELSTTSPPRLSIDPAPRQTSYMDTTRSLYEDSSRGRGVEVDPSQCVSETPAIQLESHLLLPSSHLIKQSVVMSGHLEIVSKTNTIEDVSEEAAGPVVSRPSIAVQGTVLDSHPIRDL